MRDGLTQKVWTQARELGPELREIRRRIHRRPELGFQETETAKLVAQRLRMLDIEIQEKVAQTGVVGLLGGKAPGKTLGLRADMDALPLQEHGDCAYRSQTPGVMHACGHDAHVACLLGAAEILVRLEMEIPGTVKLLFQPNEEDVPSGALAMIEAGVLNRPPVDALVALHVAPEVPCGAIGVRSGPMLAEARDFQVKIMGRAGHGAHPHETIDAIVVGAHFVAQLQSVVSRRVDPLKPAVVSVGEIHGGYSDNIIADLVELKGTVRSLESQLSDVLVEAVEQVLRGVTGAAGAEGQIRWTQGCEPLINDRDLTEVVRRATIQICGPQGLHSDIPQSMGGDDFAYFLRQVPGVLFLLGTNDGTEGTSYPLHHPRFDIDENALTTGAAVLAQVALNFLLDG